MKEKTKRLPMVVMAVALVCVLLVGSALAFNVSYQKVSMPDPYGVMPLSLNDSNTSRTFYNSKAIRVGYNSSSYTNLPAGSSLSFAHSGTTNNLWSDGTSTISKYYYLYIPASTYVDVYANIAFSANEYESLFFTGGGTYYLYTIFATSSTCAYPSTAQILVNGSPVGEAVSVSSSGAFMFPDLEVALTADVTTVGVRFTYSSAQTKTYTNTGSTGGRRLYQYFADNISITPIVKESLDYTPYLERLIAWQQSIYSNISTSNGWLSQIANGISAMGGEGGIQAVVQALNPEVENSQGWYTKEIADAFDTSTEGTVGNTIADIGSVYASEEDIALKQGTNEFTSAVTDVLIGNSDDGSSGLLDSDSDTDVKQLKNIGKRIKEWFSFDVDINELFSTVEGGGSDWYSQETANGIDSVVSTYSAEEDPYSMQDYYDYINYLFGRYGGDAE